MNDGSRFVLPSFCKKPRTSERRLRSHHEASIIIINSPWALQQKKRTVGGETVRHGTMRSATEFAACTCFHDEFIKGSTDTFQVDGHFGD